MDENAERRMTNPMEEYSDEQIEQWNKEDVFYPDEMFIAAEREEANRKMKEKNLTHEEMLSIAAEREAANKAVEDAKKFMEDNKDQLQRIAELETLERQDRINGAMAELDAIVIGGQNMREFLLSFSYIRNVLESLK